MMKPTKYGDIMNVEIYHHITNDDLVGSVNDIMFLFPNDEHMVQGVETTIGEVWANLGSFTDIVNLYSFVKHGGWPCWKGPTTKQRFGRHRENMETAMETVLFGFVLELRHGLL